MGKLIPFRVKPEPKPEPKDTNYLWIIILIVFAVRLLGKLLNGSP